jgi:hypothetical protein
MEQKCFALKSRNCFYEAKKKPRFCFIVAKKVGRKKDCSDMNLAGDLARDVGANVLYYCSIIAKKNCYIRSVNLQKKNLLQTFQGFACCSEKMHHMNRFLLQ